MPHAPCNIEGGRAECICGGTVRCDPVGQGGGRLWTEGREGASDLVKSCDHGGVQGTPRLSRWLLFVIKDDGFRTCSGGKRHLIMRLYATVALTQHDRCPLYGDLIPALLGVMPKAQDETAGDVYWNPQCGPGCLAKELECKKLTSQRGRVMCAQGRKGVCEVWRQCGYANVWEQKAPKELPGCCGQEGGG